MTYDLVIGARRAIVDGAERSCDLGIRDGQIAAIVEYGTLDLAIELGTDVVLLPGLVDTHVHVNEPGRTEWEGFATATRAAAAGGVTTIVDMPLNSIPPTVDVAALEAKQAAARDQAYVDVGFWGGAVPGNVASLKPLHDAGVFGFKCFLLHSGVDEFPPLDAAGVEAAMRELATFDGLLIVHAEDASTIDHAPVPDGRSYAAFLASRPPEAEDRAIARVIELARTTGCRVHILHLSSASALPMIAAARANGVRITAETCPHYLTFAAEEIPDGATQYKCCPPIRTAANREALWQGLAEGTIDGIGSDHSPCPPAMKRLDTGDFGAAWGGIASLQLGLPAIWTGARARGFALADVVRWLAVRPAEVAGFRRKGRIALGYDADLCAFGVEESLVVEAARLLHKHPITPYDGRRLAGRVQRTWLRGMEISESDERPHGRFLARGDA
ncbi:allantoinase AllB [Tenggerimyces flavus]|uniref:allantoinase n=1 Tax=Tenggerimyces flavus TaxID=1708749 RepID=A0ABV7YD61_9ACTN|nr:allantoinase AllB [Tenggerimyces flavus]MBM7788978.1 allantoinase [Tenggerimyces flavus]